MQDIGEPYEPDVNWCAPEHVGGVPSRRVGLRDIIPRHVPIGDGVIKGVYPTIDDEQLKLREAESDRLFEVKDTGILTSLIEFIPTEDVRGDVGTDMCIPLHAFRKVFYVDGVILNYMDDPFFDRTGEMRGELMERYGSNDNREPMYCKRTKDGTLMRTRDPVIHGYGSDSWLVETSKGWRKKLGGWHVMVDPDNMEAVWLSRQPWETPAKWGPTKDSKGNAIKPPPPKGMDSIAHLLD